MDHIGIGEQLDDMGVDDSAAAALACGRIAQDMVEAGVEPQVRITTADAIDPRVILAHRYWASKVVPSAPAMVIYEVANCAG
ncbi:hypothetical protein FEK35_23095 [Nocardia cyriacigeorgica]|uniref:Uncharacterized protein n=1 Tax=Nocardia cyriacigeorgica TaxID=135487 RepID=A0A5R8P8R0_9NOCA|nr:hypothetical protein [Nocardia cyriacigeorgica]TLG01751.1 hypothetical protein FEK35_23095 [Nocardia cyriacigeorgica]